MVPAVISTVSAAISVFCQFIGDFRVGCMEEEKRREGVEEKGGGRGMRDLRRTPDNI
jgi:hypothetical protein